MYYNNSNLANLTFINITAFDTLKSIRETLYYDSIKGILSSIFKETLSLNTISTKLGFIFNNLMKGIIEEDDIGDITLDYFRFKINPQNLNVDRKKIISSRYTGAGFDVDTRGEELIGMTYSGTTGSLVPKGLYMRLLREIESQLDLFKNVMLLNGVTGTIQNKINEICRNPKLSTAYLRFLLLELYWQHANDEMLIIWEDNAYIGKFTQFSYKLDANNPYQILYNFSIQVYPEFKYNVATGWITNSDYAIIKGRFDNRENILTANDGKILDTKKILDETLNEKLGKGFEEIGNDIKLYVQKGTDIFEGFYKSFENGFCDLGIETSLSSETNELEEWYSSLGMFAYNKNKLVLNQNSTEKTSGISITPVDIGRYYRMRGGKGIDMFEESSNLERRNVNG